MWSDVSEHDLTDDDPAANPNPSFRCGSPPHPATRVITVFPPERPLRLKGGGALSNIQVAYETFGRLNSRGDNAVFVCHALTSDSHMARHHPDDVPGWWDPMVGPGRPIDTDKYFAICANVLGGCAGTSGPASPAPDGRPHGLGFPAVEVADMVRVHRSLLDELHIPRPLVAVIGGSFGGMQSLEWLLRYPADARAFFIVAGTARHSAENLAYHAIGRAAIRSDPDFGDGRHPPGEGPRNGLGLARMTAHLSYLSEHALDRKFGRERRLGVNGDSPVIHGPFAVESYLEHQSAKLISRFDARSYLYITSAMDRFDPLNRPESIERIPDPPLVHLFSFASDRLYGVAHSDEIERALDSLGFTTTHYRETTSSAGHDAFLLDVPPYLSEVAFRMRELRAGRATDFPQASI